MRLAAVNVKKPNITSPFGLLLVVGCLLVLFAFSYLESIRVLAILWLGLDEVSDNSGLLAVACSCYLLYSKREKFRQTLPDPNLWAGIVLLFFSLLWFISKSIDVQSAHLALLPFILLAAVAFLFGNKFFKLTLIPVLILLFVIPIWWPLLPYLRELTTFTAHLNLDLLNRPVLVDNYILHLPGGSFLIDESCAGLRFLMVTVLLVFVCKDMFGHSLPRFFALLGFGIFLALIANWIRVLIIVLVGDYTNMQHSLVEDHADLGWVIFGIVVLLPFYLLNYWLAKPEQELTSVTSANSGPAVTRSKFLFVFFLTCSLLLVGPIFAFTLERLRGNVSAIQAPVALDPAIMISEEVNAQELDWTPQFQNASQYLNVGYEVSGTTVNAHFVHYQDQQQGAELINVNNVFGEGTRWSEENEMEPEALEIPGKGENISVRSLELINMSGERLLVWYWYDIGGMRSIDPLEVKLLEILALLSGRKDATLIAFSTRCELTCVVAKSTLETFLTTMIPSLANLITQNVKEI